MRVESEPDRVDSRFVLGVFAITLVVTALCCALARLVLATASSDRLARAYHQARSARPPAEINHIEADLIEGKSPEPDAAVARRRLESFGWSERQRGLVHVPLDRAFELYLAGARAAGSPSNQGGER